MSKKSTWPSTGGSLSAASEKERSDQAATQQYLDVALSELTALRELTDANYFDAAVELIECQEEKGGRVHVTGIGKQEHVAHYVASLLTSTGTPAYFLHCTEAVHGSAGQVVAGDVVIAISNSGETEELMATLTTVKQNGAKIIGVSSRRNSSLANQSDVFLYAGVRHEGSSMIPAPRASVLAEIYILSGLSVALEARKGTTLEQYRRWHPAGSLGKLCAE